MDSFGEEVTERNGTVLLTSDTDKDAILIGRELHPSAEEMGNVYKRPWTSARPRDEHMVHSGFAGTSCLPFTPAATMLLGRHPDAKQTGWMAQPAGARGCFSFDIENVENLFALDSKHGMLKHALERFQHEGFVLWSAWLASQARAGGVTTRTRLFLKFVRKEAMDHLQWVPPPAERAQQAGAISEVFLPKEEVQHLQISGAFTAKPKERTNSYQPIQIGTFRFEPEGDSLPEGTRVRFRKPTPGEEGFWIVQGERQQERELLFEERSQSGWRGRPWVHTSRLVQQPSREDPVHSDAGPFPAIRRRGMLPNWPCISGGRHPVLPTSHPHTSHR